MNQLETHYENPPFILCAIKYSATFLPFFVSCIWLSSFVTNECQVSPGRVVQQKPCMVFQEQTLASLANTVPSFLSLSVVAHHSEIKAIGDFFTPHMLSEGVECDGYFGFGTE